MKNEEGRVSTKVIVFLIIAIIILVIVIAGTFFILKSGVIKIDALDSLKSNNTIQIADEMHFIEKKNENYVFIDKIGNLIKLPASSMGERNVFTEMDSTTILYNNSILVQKDDSYSIMDFTGKTIFETKGELKKLINSKEKTLYTLYDNGKYGIVDATGKMVLPIEYENRFETFNTHYIYTYKKNQEESGEPYILSIFNTDGNKVCEIESSVNYFLAPSQVKTRNGIFAVALQKNNNTYIVLNLNTGDILQTIDISKNTEYGGNITLKDVGNALLVEWENDKESGKQGMYYWFDNEYKFINSAKNTNEQYYTAENSEFRILKFRDKFYVLNKSGKIPYSSDHLIELISYEDEINNKTYSFFRENLGGKKYKIMNSEFQTILEEDISSVGNKYILANKTLYKHDGTKYMNNVEKYYKIYDIDVIKTNDKTILENSEGKQVELDKEFNVVHNHEYLFENGLIVLDNEGVITVINKNDLSTKVFDYKDKENVYVENGYIHTYENDKEVYYNINGDEIYEKQK